MANLCDSRVSFWGPEKRLRQVVDLLRPGIEELAAPDAYGDFVLHLDHVFDDLDSEREHTYLDLWRSQTSGEWFEIRPPTDDLPDEVRRPDPVGDASETSGQAGSVSGDLCPDDPANAEHDGHELIINGTSKWAAPAPLAGRLCRMYPDLKCECSGTTEHTDYERWVGMNGTLHLVDEWVNDFRKGVIAYHRRDGIVLDPPVVEHRKPEDATDVEIDFLTEEKAEASDRGRDGVREITEEEFRRAIRRM